MSITIIIQFAVAVFLLLISIYLGLRLIKEKNYTIIYRSFSFIGITLSFALWAFSVIAVNQFGQIELFKQTIISVRLAFIGIFYASLSFYFLSKFFIYEFKDKVTKVKFIFRDKFFTLLTIIISLLTLFTQAVVSNIKVFTPIVKPEYGPYYIVFIIISLLIFFSAIKSLLFNSTKTKTLEKSQIKYLMIGTFITVIFLMITNLIIPLLTHDSSTSQFGPISLIIFSSFTLLTIIRYRFLNIRILFGRITYFLILALLIIIFYYITYIGDFILFKDSENLGSVLLGIPQAIIFIIFFNYFNKFLRNTIDTTLINPDYDPREVISNFNNKVSTVLDYNEITEYLLSTLSKTIRAQFELLILIDKDNTNQIIKGRKSITFQEESISKIINVIKEVPKYPLIIDELEFEVPPRLIVVKEQVKRLVEEMKKYEAKLIIPLTQKDQINGMLILGPKEANSPYNNIEIGFITSMAELTGLALARALLYTEVQEFNSTLQQKVNEATKEIQDKNYKLEESLHFERDMLDILGHELRTPLGTARNAILLIQMQTKNGKLTPEFINKEINIAVDNIRREVQLLETILASTKIDNNKLELKMEKVDATEVIDSSIQGNIQDADKKGLKLYFIQPNKKFYCYADRLRIQQVMDNLASNAVKYTRKGEIKITLKEDLDKIRFTISDTGEGMAQNEIPNLGKKFYRINNYLASQGTIGDRKIVRPGGTGIGLYVVFQLVKAMGGKIEVESELGKGTAFSFILDKYENQAINE